MKSKKAMPMKAKKSVVSKKVMTKKVVLKKKTNVNFWTKERSVPPMVSLSIALTLLVLAVLITSGAM